MSFDLYFAGVQNNMCEQWLIDNKMCRLLSQVNDRTYIRNWNDVPNHGKLFIDSGAYTAYTKGIEINVDEYISYLNSIDEGLTLFAQVDKIPGIHGQEKTKQDVEEAPALSWEKYLYMRERVKSPDKLLPIFHRRESWKYLETMLETTFNGKHIPYIGIAATTDSSMLEKKQWFDKVFYKIKNSSNPNVKTHAFGMTSLKMLEIFPFTSADSTSWIMVGANGSIMSPFGIVYVSENKSNYPEHILNLPKKALEQFITYLDSIGIDFNVIKTNYKYRILANCIYLKNWADNYVYKGSPLKKSLF